MAVEVAGGLGLFLLGMALLTEGLQSAAGDALRSVLARFTAGRLPAALSGVAVTALVQSSSATTIATIGFVSAGLLTFSQAVSVIIGANVGTTSTSWLVSMVGLKLQVSAFALPLIAIGALLRLFGRGRPRHVGLAVAGFGLIFVGLDVLQTGMAGVAARVDLGGLSGASLAERLLLVTIGAAMTTVMQSSSAAIATTLTALHAGAIGLPAAAALVIGQNIGTTTTAGLAAIGATVPARRTAAAHVLFNGVTGMVAFLVLPLVPAAARFARLEADPTIALAAFHSAFNMLGLMLVLPVLGPFTALVRRIVPERTPSLTRHLDASVASVPAVAVETARRTTLGVSAATLAAASRQLLAAPPTRLTDVTDARAALAQTRRFLARVRSSPDGEGSYHRHLAVLHAVDHSEHLAEAVLETGHRAPVQRDPELRAAAGELASALAGAARWAATEADSGESGDGAPAESPRAALEQLSLDLAGRRRAYRAATLERTARGECAPDDAIARLDAMLWIDRIGYHAWRAMHHLAADAPQGDENGAEPPAPAAV